ncbi:DUF4129 domain-containing protein [Candidatus Bipolaricaulota bacterium]|nr:DUF4129 domain-containing protein [Candidatus Bipolaricaulota bacterium]
MSARSRAESAFLVLAILALFGLLILLIGSLDELSFQPGKIPPRIETSEDDETTLQRVIPKLTKKDRIYAVILGGLTLVSLACVFIFRRLRNELFKYLFTALAFILPLLFAIGLFGRLFSDWFHGRSGEPAAPGPLIPEAVIANPPAWSLALAAGAVALLVLGVFTFLVIRWLAFRQYVEQRKIELADITAEQQAIAVQAANTAMRIRQGNSLQGEVIRCYREMDALLSKRRNIKPTYLTPREFADSLEELGIQTEHIRQLTELFELVRYGERDDQSLAQQALACLDRLRSVYGAKEEHGITA